MTDGQHNDTQDIQKEETDDLYRREGYDAVYAEHDKNTEEPAADFVAEETQGNASDTASDSQPVSAPSTAPPNS
jgi:hypothetical protein